MRTVRENSKARSYRRDPRKAYRNSCKKDYRRKDYRRNGHSFRNSDHAVRTAVYSRRESDLSIIRFVLTAAVFGLFLMFLLSSRANAGEKQDVTYYKYFKNVKIEAGDTLASLADRYNEPDVRSDSDYMDEVCTINNIRPDNIEAGDYVVIPYYSPEYK